LVQAAVEAVATLEILRVTAAAVAVEWVDRINSLFFLQRYLLVLKQLQ
jgi:hypothetical protein